MHKPKFLKPTKQLYRVYNDIRKLIDEFEALQRLPIPPIKPKTKKLLIDGKFRWITQDGVPIQVGSVVWWFGEYKNSPPRPQEFKVARIRANGDVEETDGTWMHLKDCYGSIYACLTHGAENYEP